MLQIHQSRIYLEIKGEKLTRLLGHPFALMLMKYALSLNFRAIVSLIEEITVLSTYMVNFGCSTKADNDVSLNIRMPQWLQAFVEYTKFTI
jgi:predicted component of type VI protein secretion system